MDISMNQKAAFPRTLPESVPDMQSQQKTQVIPQGNHQGIYTMGVIDSSAHNRTPSRGGRGAVWSMASAAISGIVDFMKQTTVVWGSPAQPSRAPTQIQPAPIPPTPPAPTTAPSLIPSWAQMFEYTNNSEWRPGTPNQKSAIDLRPELAGKIEKLEILSPDGTQVIATGTYERRGRDGRPRYKFDKAGSELPNGAILKATLKSTPDGKHGGIRYIEIPRTNKPFRF